MKKHIGVTSMMQFNTCRRRFDLEQLQQLEPDIPQSHFFLGSAVHRFLEVYYKELQQGNSIDAIEVAFLALDNYYSAELDRLATNYGSFAAEEQDHLYDNYRLACGMCQHYVDYYGDQDKWEIVDVEKYINVEIGDFEFGGKIDLVVRDKTNGRLMLIDHKTSRSGFRNEAPGLDVDEQITAYAWLYSYMTGEMPDVFMYNVLIKKSPPTDKPYLLKNGTLTTKRTGITWTADIYRETIKEHGLQEDDYAEYLEWLGTFNPSADCFSRVYVYRTAAALDNFENRLKIIMDNMQQAINKNELYPNPSTYRCDYCSVRPICAALENDENADTVIALGFRKRIYETKTEEED